MIVVCLDANAATLRRYECAEGVKVLTHHYFHESRPCEFTHGIVEEMRCYPHPDYRVRA